MDDKDYKDLDHFFKSRLNQKDAESTGWDVPSNSILDNALNQVLEAKPKRRFPLAYLFPLLLFPLLIASFLILRTNDKAEIKNLNKQVALLQSAILEKEELKPDVGSEKDLEKSHKPTTITTNGSTPIISNEDYSTSYHRYLVYFIL